MTTQTEMSFAPATDAAFQSWIHKQGGNWIMQRLFERAGAHYRHLWITHKRRCGIKLFWEQVRWYDLIPLIDSGKIEMSQIRRDGYALNNNFHALAERHLVSHRPELRGMFEEREIK